jgi:hypothetical protein
LLKENYITASCIITCNAVFKNRKLLFKNKEVDVPAFLLSVYEHFHINYPRFYKMDNLSKLGWLTAELLLDATFQKGKYKPDDIGLVLANKNSSLDTDIKYFETVKTIASPALFVYTLPNIVMGEICIRHQLKGENAFFIFDNFKPAFMQQYVHHLFETNAVQAGICGWVEIMENDYKAVLYLVEKQAGKNAVPFTEENINHIYQTANG